MLRQLESDNHCVAVGPRLVNPDGRTWRVSARRLPTLWTEFCDFTTLDRLFDRSRLFARKWYAPWNYDSDRNVECLSGAALLGRTAEVRLLGGFDESVPLYLDDMDLCRRLGQRDRKSTRLNSSHVEISYAVFCLKKKKKRINSENI